MGKFNCLKYNNRKCSQGVVIKDTTDIPQIMREKSQDTSGFFQTWAVSGLGGRYGSAFILAFLSGVCHWTLCVSTFMVQAFFAQDKP